MPRKISVRDAAIQQLSPALGSEAVVAVVFRQEDLSKKIIGN